MTGKRKLDGRELTDVPPRVAGSGDFNSCKMRAITVVHGAAMARRQRMAVLGYCTVGSNRLEEAKTFYDALLGSAGISLMFEHPSGGNKLCAYCTASQE